MRILATALEQSANLHLGKVMEEVGGGVEWRGIYSPQLGTPDFDSNRFNRMGFLEIVPKIVEAKRTISKLAQLSLHCDKVLLIDSPAFNIPLAREIKRVNPFIPIFYYILPKVWAWGEGRVEKVERWTDRQLYIFPFEGKFWKNGEYVGNPLLDYLPDVKKDREQKIAFLPGSRPSEIKKLMGLFRKLASHFPEMERELVIAPNLKKRLDLFGDLSQFKLSFDSIKTLSTARFAYICSGTATLESALLGTPFALLYRAGWLDYWIAKRLVKVKYIGLANIILTQEGYSPLHREFIQEFPIEELVTLPRKEEGEKFKEGARLLRSILQSGAAANVAKRVLDTEK